jgi:F0F1-type ATP synthase membrane subunit c/vacuolar-type H+-ATPase subunit K
MVGAGLATISLIGPGCGLGVLFGAFILGISRNPSLKGQLFISSLIAFALIEAIALFGLMIALLILFGF